MRFAHGWEDSGKGVQVGRRVGWVVGVEVGGGVEVRKKRMVGEMVGVRVSVGILVGVCIASGG